MMKIVDILPHFTPVYNMLLYQPRTTFCLVSRCFGEESPKRKILIFPD